MIFFSNYNIMKVVVFDFDETLGHFGQLGDFVTTLEEGFGKSIKREVLYKLLDIYPFTLRTDLFRILNLLKRKKQRGDINKVIIYTNNVPPLKQSNMQSYLPENGRFEVGPSFRYMEYGLDLANIQSCFLI